MKYLGIDYGSKRMGIALSDSGGSLARPVAVLKNGPGFFQELQDVIAREGVECVVIGASHGNRIQDDINELTAQITLSMMLPVEQINEAFTSVEAHGRKGKESTSARQGKAPGKPDDLDARAAAVILQRFLDKQSRSK